MDGAAKSTYIDMQVTAKPGTKTAADFARLKEAKTNFAGLLLPGSRDYRQRGRRDERCRRGPGQNHH